MHRALLLPEIIAAVVEDDGLRDADLCTLVRTCKAFTEPALDVLWCDPAAGEAVLAQRMVPELWTIQPLRLPQDGDDDESVSSPCFPCNVQDILVFREGINTRQLKDDDFGMRFAYYAKRLGRLVLSDSDPGRRQMGRVFVASAVLAVWSRMEHLFPRLRTVHIDGTYLADATYACKGFGSFLRFRGLRTLHISTHGDLLNAAAEFRDSVAEACSRITVLTIDDPYTDDPDEQAWATLFGDMLAGAHHLRVLELDRGVSIYNDSLFSLAKISALEHLTIAFNVNCACDVAFPPTAFIGLCTLDMGDHTPDARLAISLLTHCASNRLERLGVSLQCEMVHDCMIALLQQVGRHRTLTRLTLNNYGLPTSGKPITQFTPFLEALRPLPLLQTLHVHGDAILPVDMDTVAHVMQLYPRLCRWTLSNRLNRYPVESEQAARTPVTLSVLMEILRSHPHLTEMPVLINSPDLPSEEAQAAFGVHPYRRISVKRSAATPALRLVIQRLFPQADLGQ